MAARDRVVVDVNTLAILLVQDHPGNPYITPEMEKGLRGQFIPLILDIIPLRAYWIMTKKWRCDAEQSEKAIRHFLYGTSTRDAKPETTPSTNSRHWENAS